MGLDTLGNIIQNFMLLLAGYLIVHAVYLFGRYQAFHKIRLSRICPELTDLEAYDEYLQLSRLFAEVAVDLEVAERKSKSQQ